MFDAARDLPDVHLLEDLKWGQPAWRPQKPRVGSTLRAHWTPSQPETLSLMVHCQTTLATTMRDIYPDAFHLEGNRALHMPLDAPLPVQAIAHCAQLTFTYHRKSA